MIGFIHFEHDKVWPFWTKIVNKQVPLNILKILCLKQLAEKLYREWDNKFEPMALCNLLSIKSAPRDLARYRIQSFKSIMMAIEHDQICQSMFSYYQHCPVSYPWNTMIRSISIMLWLCQGL